MAEYSNLSATINAQIRANGVQAITGPVLNAVLAAMVNVQCDGYTLQFSADGENFTDWFEATPADKTQVVTNAANGMYFKLGGNVGEVVITY